MKKLFFMALIICLIPLHSFAASLKIPENVLDISKENTYPNPTHDLLQLEPSALAKSLLESSNVKIANPDLVHILNETSVAKAPLAIGYKATIYLGKWALNYESTSTTVNWQYKKINVNYSDNRAGKAPYKMHYAQANHVVIKGGLTSSVEFEDDVKRMILLKSMEKTDLPLSFQTAVGIGTKSEKTFPVPKKQLGYLHGYAPAVNEKGKVTYGEVYLLLRGGKKSLVVKNITSQGIGAWIPLQDKVTVNFTSEN